MSEYGQYTGPGSDIKRSLKATVSAIKNRRADQDDVVVELKAAENARLELLATELQPIISEIDETDERFDFALSKGRKSRLWIDMSSFIAMGQDKRHYRFLKDTRMGRLVLAETDDMIKMADVVSEYIAEKVLDRERMLDDEWVYLRDLSEQAKQQKSADPYEPAPSEQPLVRTENPNRPRRLRGFLWFLFGVVCSLIILVAAAFILAPDAF